MPLRRMQLERGRNERDATTNECTSEDLDEERLGYEWVRVLPDQCVAHIRDGLGTADGVDRRDDEVDHEACASTRVQAHKRETQAGRLQHKMHARVQYDGHGRKEDGRRETEEHG